MPKKQLNILLLLISFFLYYVFIGPLYKGVGGVFSFGEGVSTLKNKKAEYDSALVEAERLLKDAKEKVVAYQKISEEEKRSMKIMLPESVDKIRLLHELSAISVSTGIPLKDLMVSENQAQADGKGVVNLSFTTKTTYSTFKELMSVIEKSMRLYSVKTVAFNAPEEGGLISFNVTLETYYLK